MLRRIVDVLLAVAFAVFGCTSLSAQEWPQRTLKIVAIAPPGGLIDIAARILADHLVPVLGQPVVVENRPGAGGNIAAPVVASSPPDGYTLLISGNNLSMNQILIPDPTFNYERDLAPVAMLVSADTVMVANPALPARNMSEFLEIAKHRDTPFPIAVASMGTPNHLAAELLVQLTGIDFTFIPYAGVGQQMPDIMSGRIQVMFSALPSVFPFLKAGSVKGLAVTRPQRSKFAPDIPSAAELGLPGLDVSSWICIMTTAGTPAPVIRRLHDAIQDIMQLQDVRESFAAQAAEPFLMSSEELGRYMKMDTIKWTDVLKHAKMKKE